MEIGNNHEMNLTSLKKLAKDEDLTVNVVNKEKCQTQSHHKHSNEGTNKQDIKRMLQKEKKDQKRKTSLGGVVVTKHTRNVQQMGQWYSFCKKMNHYSKL